jgi:hypothetical protein
VVGTVMLAIVGVALSVIGTVSAALQIIDSSA